MIPPSNISMFHLQISRNPLKNDGLGLLNRTADLMDYINNFSPDMSGCDMADMLLPPPGGKSTKGRSANDFSDVPDLSAINDLLKAGLSPEELVSKLLGGASGSQLENPRSPLKKNTTQQKLDITGRSEFDESFAPMSYSIIDKDEESAMKKDQFGSDITLVGIENSDISWQMNSSDISLFHEHGKSSRSERFPMTEHLRSGIPDRSYFNWKN
ncbi:hypothetical protein GE061_018526 [Apolygus lucorum]|uniref:Uncharacterized protein n=1 Tax=Apolygus lucorum TaxID=248454 RepID=A0A8S9XI72_APOLU|nr:hypothetical protein GE061_018526 [Apolygus lucorum]